MQTIIRHKWIRSSAILSVLLVWVMVWGLRGDGSRAEAAIEKIEIAVVEFPPTGVGPERLVEITAVNTICSAPAQVAIRVFDAEDGDLVGSTGPGIINPGTGRILTLFEPDGLTERRNIFVQVQIGCAKVSLIRKGRPRGGIVSDPGVGLRAANASMEVVDAETGRTVRRVEGRWTDHNSSDPG